MSVERDLLGRWHNGDLLPEEYMKLMKDTKELLAQPEHNNTQYLLDQVARLTAENAMLKEKWSEAQPEQEQEPVAWIIETEIYGKLSEWICTDKKRYMEAHDATKDPIPLYTAPPKREPFGPEERQRLSKAYSTRAEQVAFEEGIIFAEISYGIGGGE